MRQVGDRSVHAQVRDFHRERHKLSEGIERAQAGGQLRGSQAKELRARLNEADRAVQHDARDGRLDHAARHQAELKSIGGWVPQAKATAGAADKKPTLGEQYRSAHTQVMDLQDRVENAVKRGQLSKPDAARLDRTLNEAEREVHRAGLDERKTGRLEISPATTQRLDSIKSMLDRLEARQPAAPARRAWTPPQV